MTFRYQTETLVTTVNAIADNMIGLTGSWVEGDSTITTSYTNPGRVLKYNESGREFYVAFMIAEWGYATASSGYRTTGGIRVFVSSGWDSGNHIPSGTVKCSQIPAYTWYKTPLSASYAAGITWTTWMWYENEMLVMAWQSASTGYYDSVGVFTMQYTKADKFYDDDASDWFFYSTCHHVGFNKTSGSADYYMWGTYSAQWTLNSAWAAFLTYNIYKYIHPFLVAYPTTAIAYNPGTIYGDGFEDGYDAGRTWAIVPERARKSLGDSKVYMSYVIVCNDATETLCTPIAKLVGFFPVVDSSGIADGDLINVTIVREGRASDTWQYMYKYIVSPDTGSMQIAIKYAEP
jgi:hypothetical protein